MTHDFSFFFWGASISCLSWNLRICVSLSTASVNQRTGHNINSDGEESCTARAFWPMTFKSARWKIWAWRRLGSPVPSVPTVSFRRSPPFAWRLMDNPGADQKKMRSVRAFSLFLLAAAAGVQVSSLQCRAAGAKGREVSFLFSGRRIISPTILYHHYYSLLGARWSGASVWTGHKDKQTRWFIGVGEGWWAGALTD